jgi:hypothetical protein
MSENDAEFNMDQTDIRDVHAVWLSTSRRRMNAAQAEEVISGLLIPQIEDVGMASNSIMNFFCNRCLNLMPKWTSGAVGLVVENNDTLLEQLSCICML